MNVSRVSSPVAAVWNGNIYILPPEIITRDLITRYFSNTGLLFPYLHEQAFLETYAQMKNDKFQKVRRTWLGLLNMVLALATSTTVQSNLAAKKRAVDSDVYYQRALQLCEKQLMRGTSLEVGTWLVSRIRQADEYLNGLVVMVMLMMFEPFSTMPSPNGPVPPRNAKVSPDMDDPWISCQGSLVTWSAL